MKTAAAGMTKMAKTTEIAGAAASQPLPPATQQKKLQSKKHRAGRSKERAPPNLFRRNYSCHGEI